MDMIGPTLEAAFGQLAMAMDGPRRIERQAAQALRRHAGAARLSGDRGIPLPDAFVRVMSAHEAHPVCALLLDLPFRWAPPLTSPDPAYLALSSVKVHVELIGPDGLVRDDSIRLGLYGLLPSAEYGLRTHPAEEEFVMLAGKAEWKRGEEAYQWASAGDRSYHASMLPHATRTGPDAFMSAYVWAGDVSTDKYVYAGVPPDDRPPVQLT